MTPLSSHPRESFDDCYKAIILTAHQCADNSSPVQFLSRVDTKYKRMNSNERVRLINSGSATLPKQGFDTLRPEGEYELLRDTQIHTYTNVKKNVHGGCMYFQTRSWPPRLLTALRRMMCSQWGSPPSNPASKITFKCYTEYKTSVETKFLVFLYLLKKNVILLSHGNWKRRHLMFSFRVNAGWRWNISWISQFSVLSCVSPAGSWSVKAAALRHPLRLFTDLSHRPVSICRHIYCRLLSQISSSEPKNLTDAVLQFQLWARFSEK